MRELFLMTYITAITNIFVIKRIGDDPLKTTGLCLISVVIKRGEVCPMVNCNFKDVYSNVTEGKEL